MACVQCTKELKVYPYRQTRFIVLVCTNNCYSWFHDSKCLQNWTNNYSDLNKIDMSKPIMTDEDFLAVDLSIVRNYTDYPCPNGECNGNIIGMKTLVNLDQPKHDRASRYRERSDSSSLYDTYIKESGQWQLTWKKFINDQIRNLKEELSWKCFDDTTKIKRENTGNGNRGRLMAVRIATDREYNRQLVTNSHKYYYRHNMKPDEIAKLKEINEKRRRILDLIDADPTMNINELVLTSRKSAGEKPVEEKPVEEESDEESNEECCYGECCGNCECCVK